MSSPKLTIGMAHWDDMNSALLTIQSIRANIDKERLKDFAFLLVDNSAESVPRASKSLTTFMNNIGGTYVPYPNIQGTSEPRNHVFRNAKTPFVACIDCHMVPLRGAFEALLDYFERNPTTKNIVHGPFCTDRIWNNDGSMGMVGDHMDDRWRSNMHGTWGSIWQCPCGKLRFSVIDKNAKCRYIKLKLRPYGGDFEDVGHHCDDCDVTLPNVAHSGYERRLYEAGFKVWLNWDAAEKEIEIPAMGLGSWACVRENWVGLTAGCEGFGGEEVNLHIVNEQAGGKTICLKDWVLWHKFYKDRITYAARIGDMIRNQLKWHKRIGCGNEEMFECYVKRTPQLITEDGWKRVLDTPDDYEVRTVKVLPEDKVKVLVDMKPSKTYGRPQPPDPTNPDKILRWFVTAKEARRDMNDHMPMLYNMAQKCKHVTEFSHRRESRVALALALPETFISYNNELDEIKDALRLIWRQAETTTPRNVKWNDGPTGPDGSPRGSLITAIEPTDLLFLNTEPSHDNLLAELRMYAPNVRRWIARNNTDIWGEVCPSEKGDKSDAPKGFNKAFTTFLEENPEWFVYYHDPAQYGFTVLGRLPEDRPARKIWIWDPGFGPGTELKSILASLGYTTSPKCDCARKAAIMDRWGVAGCKEHRAMIEKWLNDNRIAWKWDDQEGSLKRAMKAASSRVGWQAFARMLKGEFDPSVVLTDMAITFSEQKGHA